MDMGFTDSRSLVASDMAPALRPLGWSELCARLVAAQDLRRARMAGFARLAAGAAGPVGSFHGAAAHMLAHHSPAQDFVNPTSSAIGKDNQGTSLTSREIPLIERTTRQADETCHD